MARIWRHLVRSPPCPDSFKNHESPLTDNLLNLFLIPVGTLSTIYPAMKAHSMSKYHSNGRGTSHSIRYSSFLVILFLFSISNSGLALQVKGKLHFNCNYIIIFMSSLRCELDAHPFIILVQTEWRMHSSLPFFDRITRSFIDPDWTFYFTS